jgi:hypothetical protein
MRLGKAGTLHWMAASMAESLAPEAEKGALKVGAKTQQQQQRFCSRQVW